MNRYDRQIRLWANAGQSNLETAHVCLVNGTPTGTEALKNLVLPGVGQFTIVDSTIVTLKSLGGNFFLSEADIGKSRAESIAKNLSHLNPAVRGHHELRPLVELDNTFWSQFTCVIVLDLVEDFTVLQQILWDNLIPLLVVDTIGYYGALRIIVPEVTVIETHDPSKLMDLRLDKPWPELQSYVDSIDLSTLNDVDHAHVPYIVIFIKALQKWIDDHGTVPKLYAEKLQFQSSIADMLRNLATEGNFSEAKDGYIRALHKTVIPPELTRILESEKAKVSKESSIFWILVASLKLFISEVGSLPLLGELPDMVSDTKSYVAMQKLYHEKSLVDQAKFLEKVKYVMISIGRDIDDIDDQVIKLFCKNARQLYVAEGSASAYSHALIESLLDSKTEGTSRNMNLLAIYFGMLALKNVEESQVDFKIVTNEFKTIIQKQDLPQLITDTIAELVAHSTRDYHNMCAFMGGVVSQEILKLATVQYVPVDNLFIYDGVRLLGASWRT